MLRWSDGDCEVVEGLLEPVVPGDVGGDVVVAAAQVLDKRVTGGEGSALTGNSSARASAGAGL